MGATARLSEEYHEQITDMAESSDKTIQEVMDSVLDEALDDHDPEPAPADAIGRCPHTGEVFTENDVQVDRRGRYVEPDAPTHIPVEELEPVGE